MKPDQGDFQPSERDLDGLSFFDTAGRAAEQTNRPGIAQFSVDWLRANGYTVTYNGSDRIPGSPFPPGHVSVRRVNQAEWNAWFNWEDKQWAKWLSRNYIPPVVPRMEVR